MADLVGRDAHAVTINPYGIATAPTAGRPCATAEPKHRAIIVIEVKTHPPCLLARIRHLQSESVDITTVGGVALHIPGFVLWQFHGRRDRGQGGQFAER